MLVAGKWRIRRRGENVPSTARCRAGHLSCTDWTHVKSSGPPWRVACRAPGLTWWKTFIPPRSEGIRSDGACAAAVDEEFGAGEVAGPVGDEECHEITDVARGAGLS